jgi:hypothetical protein
MALWGKLNGVTQFVLIYAIFPYASRTLNNF